MSNPFRGFWLLCLLLAFGLQSMIAPAQGFAMAWQQHTTNTQLGSDVFTEVPPCHAALSSAQQLAASDKFSFGAKCSHCAACIMTAALPTHDIGLAMQVYGSDALIVFIPQSFVSYIAEVLDPPPRQLI